MKQPQRRLHIKTAIIFVLLCFSVATNSHAQGKRIVINDDNFRMYLDNDAQYLRTGADQQLSDVMRGGMPWQHRYSIEPVAEEEAIWIKTSFSYQRIESARYTFVVGNPNLDYVDIYVMDRVGRIMHSAMIGANRPFQNRPINFKEFALPFELDYGQEFDIYVRVKDEGPMVFSLYFYKSTEIIKKATAELTFIGAISGALTILAAYFLVTYFMLHSPVRFWFAMVNLVFLVMFLNIEGILGQITGMTQHMATVTVAMLGMVLFCASKISHAMLIGMPKYWRDTNYILSTVFIFAALALNSYWQIVVAAGLGSAAMLLQLFLAIRYRNPFNSLPNRILVVGWSTLVATNLVHVCLFLTGSILSTGENLMLTSLLMVAILMVAAAIESHEKVLIHKEYEQQQDTIADLQRFYDFFSQFC